MSNPEKSEGDGKHSPYRILIIGAVLTTIGSIVTGLVLSWVNDDSEKEPSASGRTATTTANAPASATPMLDPAHAQAFVADIGGDFVVEGAVEINGERFTYGASGHCPAGCGMEYADFIEFNLSRDYKTFRATLGFADRSPQGPKRLFRILADGKLLYEKEIGLGESDRVALDVKGALRLRLEVLGLHFQVAAIGDPSVE